MPLGANKAAIMGVAGVSTENIVLLATETAAGDASITFTSDINSTYGEYIFGFYNIHPETDDIFFGFQVNASGESGYNETITSTYFHANHEEADDGAEVTYVVASDQAQGTALQHLTSHGGNDNDASVAGILHLFNPSSTTYAKHFYGQFHLMGTANAKNAFPAGYINVTAAITEIEFKFSSGNIDAGKIKMWGVK